MNCLLFVACVCSILSFCQAIKLPSYFKPCKLDDPNLGKCIEKSGNAGISSIIPGDNTYHIPNLNPLHIKQMYLNVGNNLQVNITEADIHGLDGAVLQDIKWSFEKKRLEAVITAPLVGLTGTYDVAGRILILPINGHGPCNISFVEGVFKYTMNYEAEQRRNKDYLKIVDNSFTYTVKRAYFKLHNLFNGDKRLGGEMSKFLDDNWMEVNNEIGARVGDALGDVFSAVLQGFFYRVPLEQLFVK